MANCTVALPHASTRASYDTTQSTKKPSSRSIRSPQRQNKPQGQSPDAVAHDGKRVRGRHDTLRTPNNISRTPRSHTGIRVVQEHNTIVHALRHLRAGVLAVRRCTIGSFAQRKRCLGCGQDVGNSRDWWRVKTSTRSKEYSGRLGDVY